MSTLVGYVLTVSLFVGSIHSCHAAAIPEFEVNSSGLERGELEDPLPAYYGSQPYDVNKRAVLRLGKRALMRLGKRAMMRLGKRAPMRLGLF